jgi:calcium permeable stress-gated cation channel
MSDTFGNIINGAAGSAQHKQGTTVQTLAVSVAAGFVLFGVQFSAFLIVRNYLWAKRIYQPRSFLIPLKDRVKPPPNNPLRWISMLLQTSPETVLRKAGMDAYFFLRYLAMCLKIFGPSAIIILPILIPINFVNGKGTRTVGTTHYNVTGLDTVAWSNVALEHTSRYWTHLILAILVIAWVCYLFHHELLHYVAKRQEYLGSPSHRLKASSTTVLITSIPRKLCTTAALMELYDDFPGGVRRIWLNRNFDSLVSKDKLRRQWKDCLENAETNLIRRVVKQHRKKWKKDNEKTTKDSSALEETMATAIDTNSRSRAGEKASEPTAQAACEDDLQYDLATKALWTEYVSPKQRAYMRIPRTDLASAFRIPLAGRFLSLKVDTIYYCRRELARLNREIETEIEEAETCPQNGSAFIQFNTQKGAHMACQAVPDTKPGRMTQRMVELSPADINWSALNYTRQNRALRLVLFVALFILLVLVFGLISFFTGILSKLSTLSGSTAWLGWISALPRWLLSFIQGTLPAVILVIVLSGPTPIVLRAMTNRTRGATTGSQGERSLQLWYFIFLVFELLIIPTISSGLTSIIRELIRNTASVPEILATNLPTAANYYFSFLVLQTLSISSSSILQTIRLLSYYVFGRVNTPDSVYNKMSFTWRTRIGSNIPWYTTFAVIGLVYSVIAPLILIFMLLTFGLFYIVIKNNVLYVIRTGDVDSGGLWFPSAINQTFTGLYFMEICMIGLFFLVRDTRGKVACEAQGIVMSIVFVLTVSYQIWLAVNFNGLYKYAPLRLEGEALVQDREYEATRLTSDLPRDRPASENSVEANEPPLDTTGKSNASAQQAENISRPPIHPEQQCSSTRSLSTAGVARLSTDVGAQREHDKQQAKHILARLNRPLDESRLAELESHLAQVEARVGNTLIPRQRDVEAQMMNDPISKIIMQHNDELEDLNREERDLLVSVAFTHPVLRQTKPSVWIPRDELGVSDDEVRRTRELSQDLAIDNRGAFFNSKLKVEIDRPPPDTSEFAWVMAEL